METVTLCLFTFRFREVPSLWQAVTKFVQAHPLAISDDPEALQFLVTEETIREDLPNLSHVLTWAKVPPVTALSYFSRQYAPHPLTAQYAVRVLQSYPAVSRM